MTDELHHDHPGSIDPDETLSLDEAHEGIHEHLTNVATMTWVFAILLFLTALTVWTSRMHVIPVGNTLIDFGTTPHIVMAMVIAVVKAILVAAYFMHLKYDKPMNTVVVGATLFGVVLFIGLTLADLNSRDMIDKRETTMNMLGGDKHFDPETGERVQGVGVVQAARDANPEAHGEHGDEPGDDESHVDGDAGHDEDDSHPDDSTPEDSDADDH